MQADHALHILFASWPAFAVLGACQRILTQSQSSKHTKRMGDLCVYSKVVVRLAVLTLLHGLCRYRQLGECH